MTKLAHTPCHKKYKTDKKRHPPVPQDPETFKQNHAKFKIKKNNSNKNNKQKKIIF